ncbi:transposable element Tc1 transposase [Trichonephila clavipes]|nr:transposable element Tc1 transposase [Trichonephila clavipes]
MPRRQKGAKFEQISEFERGRIVGLREAGLSYRAVAARVQRNSSTIMRVSMQWTDEGRTARKSGSGARNVTIPLTENHRRLPLQWANVHKSWCADWQQVIFSDESLFNLWHYHGRIRVRRYAGERHIPECIIERDSGRTVMVWGAIAYHGRSQLLRIQDNVRPHVAKTLKSYLDSQQVQLLPWPAYSPDMSLIQHVWDIVGRRLARDLRPVASTDEL